MNAKSVRPTLELLEDRRVPALVLQLDAAGDLNIAGQQTGNLSLTETAPNTIQVRQGTHNLGSYRVTGQIYTTSYHSAGVVREDDYEAGRVGFYDTYDRGQGGESGGRTAAMPGGDGGDVER